MKWNTGHLPSRLAGDLARLSTVILFPPSIAKSISYRIVIFFRGDTADITSITPGPREARPRLFHDGQQACAELRMRLQGSTSLRGLTLQPLTMASSLLCAAKASFLNLFSSR